VNPRRRMTPEEKLASKDRANQKRRLRRLWSSDSSLDEICEEMGMGEDELLAYAAGLGLKDRDPPDCYIPTPLEIRLATASIRMGWTQAERDARLEGRLSDRLEDATTEADNDAR
jgi:hypothetical protein